MHDGGHPVEPPRCGEPAQGAGDAVQALDQVLLVHRARLLANLFLGKRSRNGMIDEVVAGVLVNAVTATGRRLGSAAGAHRGRRTAEDLAIARWFDTYHLTERVPELPELPSAEAERLAGILRSDAAQAVLHELLAARLTDAPEQDAGRIR